MNDFRNNKKLCFFKISAARGHAAKGPAVHEFEKKRRKEEKKRNFIQPFHFINLQFAHKWFSVETSELRRGERVRAFF